MYSPSAYFLAGWLSSTINLMVYPLITGSICFKFIEMNNDSFENYLNWISIMAILTVQGSSYGFMWGCIIDDVEAGINCLQYTLMVWLFGSGFYVNLKTANWFIKFLGYISPFRYTSEKLLRVMLNGLSYVDDLCNFYDFTFDNNVVKIAAFFALGFFLLSWFMIVIKTKNQ